jgi:hypothetical protein
MSVVRTHKRELAAVVCIGLAMAGCALLVVQNQRALEDCDWNSPIGSLDSKHYFKKGAGPTHVYRTILVSGAFLAAGLLLALSRVLLRKRFGILLLFLLAPYALLGSLFVVFLVDSAASPCTVSNEPAVPMLIRVFASVTSARAVDLPPRGVVSRNDEVVVESQLRNVVPQFDKANGAIVGRDQTTITYGLRGESAFVKVEVTLPDGRLHLRATVDVAGPSAEVRIPVVDGTGAFRSATGYLRTRSGRYRDIRSASETSLNAYHLRLP